MSDKTQIDILMQEYRNLDGRYDFYNSMLLLRKLEGLEVALLMSMTPIERVDLSLYIFNKCGITTINDYFFRYPVCVLLVGHKSRPIVCSPRKFWDTAMWQQR